MLACVKNMQPDRVYIHMDPFFHFSIKPPDPKAVENKNRREINFSSQGWGNDYGDLLESLSYRRRAGGNNFRDGTAHVHNKLQIIFSVSYRETSSAQSCNKHISIKKHLSVFSCQATHFSDVSSNTATVDFPETKVYVKRKRNVELFRIRG